MNRETYLERGVVERVLDGTFQVRSGSTTTPAKLAKSCLVAPEARDTVLCSFGPDGAFVLAVLEGQTNAPTRVVAAGDLQIEARNGRFAVSSSHGIDLVSIAAVSMAAAEVRVRAASGSIAVEDLGFVGRLIRAELSKLVVAAEEVDHLFTRLTERAKRVFRFVEEIDQTRAGTIDLRAQNLVGIRGENAVISARVLAKIDGEQIHLG